MTGNFQVTETFTVTGGQAYASLYNQFNTLGIQSHVDSSGDFWAFRLQPFLAPFSAVVRPV